MPEACDKHFPNAFQTPQRHCRFLGCFAAIAAINGICVMLYVLFQSTPQSGLTEWSALLGAGDTKRVFAHPNSLLGGVRRRAWSHFICHQTPPSRACHFQSVCWDRVEQAFVYYDEPGQLPLVHSSTGKGFDWEIRPDFVRATNDATHLGPDKTPFLPLIRARGPIPQDHVFAPEAVHVYFVSHYAENFGHAIGDDILPVYALQSMFGLLTADVKLLTPRDFAETAGDVDTAPYRRARKFLSDMAQVISDHPIGEMFVDPLYRQVSSRDQATGDSGPRRRHTCFTSLLTGHSQTGFSQDAGRYFAPLSDYMLQRAMALFPSVREAANIKHSRQRVVVIKKVGRRAILNVEELVHHLKRTFDVKVDVVNPAGMDLHEQMALALSSTLILTPEGGISFISAFVRARTPVIFVGHWVPSRNISDHLDWHVWQPARRFVPLFYDVRASEVAVLPPGNTTHPTDTDYHIHGGVTIDKLRMSRVAASGLLIAEREFDIPPPSFSMAQSSAFADLT
jgi:hypothetical protein